MLDFMRSCPSPNKLFPETVRRPLRDLVTGVCPRISSAKRLRAADFQASNADHLRTVYDMGITMVSLGEGKVQLLHSFYNVSLTTLAMSGRFYNKPFSFSTGQIPGRRRTGARLYAGNGRTVQVQHHSENATARSIIPRFRRRATRPQSRPEPLWAGTDR